MRGKAMDSLGGPVIQAAIGKQERVRDILEALPNLPPDQILKALNAAKRINKSCITILKTGEPR
jgi:uncharacterized protein (DUF433 family)